MIQRTFAIENSTQESLGRLTQDRNELITHKSQEMQVGLWLTSALGAANKRLCKTDHSTRTFNAIDYYSHLSMSCQTCGTRCPEYLQLHRNDSGLNVNAESKAGNIDPINPLLGKSLQNLPWTAGNGTSDGTEDVRYVSGRS